jgi:hypothetical protein
MAPSYQFNNLPRFKPGMLWSSDCQTETGIASEGADLAPISVFNGTIFTLAANGVNTVTFVNGYDSLQTQAAFTNSSVGATPAELAAFLAVLLGEFLVFGAVVGQGTTGLGSNVNVSVQAVRPNIYGVLTVNGNTVNLTQLAQVLIPEGRIVIPDIASSFVTDRNQQLDNFYRLADVAFLNNQSLAVAGITLNGSLIQSANITGNNVTFPSDRIKFVTSGEVVVSSITAISNILQPIYVEGGGVNKGRITGTPTGTSFLLPAGNFSLKYTPNTVNGNCILRINNR